MTAVLAVLVLAAPGCGGGGGGGGPTGPPPPPPQSLTFTPAATAGINTIFLRTGPGTDFNNLVLQVRANEVDDLYGVAFDLVYPAELLSFRANRTDEGRFLRGPGVGTSLVVEEAAGRLLISYTRLGADAGGESGSGVLFTVEFATTSSGQGALELASTLAYDGSGARRFDYDWVGGSLVVQK
jgi:hypothetical protein